MENNLGQTLMQARLERGLSLEQVSQGLHIRVNYLEALENNQRQNLPSPVQGKGFLRLYADFLRLPLQPLLDEWDGKTRPVVPPTSLPQVEEEITSETSQTYASPETQIAEAQAPENDTPPQVPEAIEELPSQLTEVSAPPVVESNSALIFKEIGQKLRQQREGLLLTISDIERHIKIRQRYLQALEEGKIEDLPSPVQGRGMLSNYAHFLEMDSESLLNRFADGLQMRHQERMPPAPPTRTNIFTKKTANPAPFWRRFITPDLMLGSAIILAIFLFVLWGAAQITSYRENAQVVNTPPSISQVILSVPTITPQVTQAENQAPNPADITEGLATRRPNANQEGSEPTATVPAIGSDPLQVYIVAKLRAYVQVFVDNKEVFAGRVIPGNAYPYSGTDRIEVVSGNAAALQIFFNQNEIGSLGLNGQNVRLIFSKDGMRTPTPAPSATPTKTPIFSATPRISPTATLKPPTVTPFIPR
jgi:cytoskeletal protein RodZ